VRRVAEQGLAEISSHDCGTYGSGGEKAGSGKVSVGREASSRRRRADASAGGGEERGAQRRADIAERAVIKLSYQTCGIKLAERADIAVVNPFPFLWY